MCAAPIKITAEAEEFLRSALASAPHDMDAALVWAPQVQDSKDVPAVILGWYEKGRRPGDSFFDLWGYAVSIMPTTLEHIQEKTISRERFNSGLVGGPKHLTVLKVS
jgi:hypothetical protein